MYAELSMYAQASNAVNRVVTLPDRAAVERALDGWEGRHDTSFPFGLTEAEYPGSYVISYTARGSAASVYVLYSRDGRRLFSRVND